MKSEEQLIAEAKSDQKRRLVAMENAQWFIAFFMRLQERAWFGCTRSFYEHCEDYCRQLLAELRSP